MPPVILQVFDDQTGMYIREKHRGRFYWHSSKKIRKAFTKSKNLRALSESLHVQVRSVLKILKLAGAKFIERLWSEYQANKTWAEVASNNGMKTRTLTKLMKENGYSVQRGPKIRNRDETEFVEAVRTSGTPGRLAKKLKISWPTALAIFVKRFQILALYCEDADVPRNINHTDRLRRMGLYWVRHSPERSESNEFEARRGNLL